MCKRMEMNLPTLRQKLEQTLTVYAFDKLARLVKEKISHNGWAEAMKRPLGADPTISVMTIAKVMNEFCSEKIYAEELLDNETEFHFDHKTQMFVKVKPLVLIENVA